MFNLKLLFDGTGSVKSTATLKWLHYTGLSQKYNLKTASFLVLSSRVVVKTRHEATIFHLLLRHAIALNIID